MKQITLNVDRSKNCTPADLMNAYARLTPGVVFTRNYWGNARLVIGGVEYEYHHWNIDDTGDKLKFTIWLSPVG